MDQPYRVGYLDSTEDDDTRYATEEEAEIAAMSLSAGADRGGTER